jgi:hypothetical protein
MENINTNTTLSDYLKATVLASCLFISGMFFNATAQQTFKASSPAEAQPLVKDSIDNFLSFSPVFVEGKTYLRWLVQNDRKDGVFIVERSANGTDFEALGFKDRVGTTKSVNLFYSWIDDAPPAGFAHYRVMQVGVDHTFNYSDIVRVKTTASQSSGGSAIQTDSEKK